ncbi:MAG: RraA family protein [Paracoccaceae bacterium]|nr:RraA family protein [Paracoccaceae bacterium]
MIDPRIEQFSKCYTGVVHDVMRARGLRDFTLPPRITPLQPEMTLCGPAWTVEGAIDEAADPHQTLLDWTGLLSKAASGHIWCAQPNNHLIAQMGELSAETLHAKGVLGCVLDGALRDANFILELGFPCWRTHHTPRDVVGMWRPSTTDAPITIGEVRIEPGDWLHGDRDGMVRVPVAILDEIIEAASEAMVTENKVRTAILSGVDPQDAYLQYGKF